MKNMVSEVWNKASDETLFTCTDGKGDIIGPGLLLVSLLRQQENKLRKWKETIDMVT